MWREKTRFFNFGFLKQRGIKIIIEGYDSMGKCSANLCSYLRNWQTLGDKITSSLLKKEKGITNCKRQIF